MNKEKVRQVILDAIEIPVGAGCWVWTHRCKTDSGYGIYRQTGVQESRAHRLAYMVWKGDIPEGKIARHLCHNPACCNPDHIALGTQADNAQDMVKARRYNNETKYTDEQIIEVYDLRAEGKAIGEIHEITRIPYRYLDGIIAGTKRKFLHEQHKHRFQHVNHNPRKGEETARKVKHMIKHGYKNGPISRYLGISVTSVSYIRCGKTWANLEI